MNKKIFLLPLLALLALASCDDNDDNYKPASPVGSDNWGVYFDADNECEFVREPEDNPVITIKIKRDNTNGALTVPLKVTKLIGDISVPESVTFADGESEKDIEVTYYDFPNTRPKAIISIPEFYTNPYKEKHGFSQQRIELLKTELIVSDIQIMTPTNSDYTEFEENMFSGCKSQIKWYVGKNKFVYTNFLGSGIDLIFRFDVEHGATFDPNDLNKCGGGIVPLSNNNEDGEYGWYLSTDKNPNADSPYACWTPEGADKGVEEYIYFYNHYDGYDYCSLYFNTSEDPDNPYGYVDFFAVIIDDDDSYHLFSFITLNDEFK